MRIWIFLLIGVLWTGVAEAQKNKPRIRDQRPISTNEDEPVTVNMNDLEVRDRDNWFYPFGFTMTLFPGNNYEVNGHTVTPAENFSGRLEVRVIVNDGEHDSDPYDLRIDVRPVNDAPVITGNRALSANSGEPITIQPGDLTIVDPDNSNFTIALSPGSSYSLAGNTLTSTPGYSGVLTVPVQASDGSATSQPYSLPITIIPRNNPPKITGQKTLTYNEDVTFAINLTDLIVSDSDNQYPADFTLKIQPGQNYTFNGNLVTPLADWNGKLAVNVIVNDGKDDSDVYPATVTLLPIGDAPKIINLEPEALIYIPGKPPVAVTQTAEVVDVDTDSISSMEIAFLPQNYAIGFDQLKWEGTSTRIKGTFDQMKGVLSLTGSSSTEEYTQALRSVQYSFLAAPESFMEGKKLSIKISNGSMESASVEREIRSKALDIALDIPKAFTPNGDLSNDTWTIRPLKQSEELKDAVVRVYHRSGALLYEAIGFERPWDGRSNGEMMPADSYFFTIDFGDAFRKAAIKGVVTLLR